MWSMRSIRTPSKFFLLFPEECLSNRHVCAHGPDLPRYEPLVGIWVYRRVLLQKFEILAQNQSASSYVHSLPSHMSGCIRVVDLRSDPFVVTGTIHWDDQLHRLFRWPKKSFASTDNHRRIIRSLFNTAGSGSIRLWKVGGDILLFRLFTLGM